MHKYILKENTDYIPENCKDKTPWCTPCHSQEHADKLFQEEAFEIHNVPRYWARLPAAAKDSALPVRMARPPQVQWRRISSTSHVGSFLEYLRLRFQPALISDQHRNQPTSSAVRSTGFLPMSVIFYRLSNLDIYGTREAYLESCHYTTLIQPGGTDYRKGYLHGRMYSRA